VWGAPMKQLLARGLGTARSEWRVQAAGYIAVLPDGTADNPKPCPFDRSDPHRAGWNTHCL
jgi:hypothetical protein